MWWLIGVAVYLIVGFVLSFIVVRPDEKMTGNNLWKESPFLACIVTVGWGVIIFIFCVTKIGALARKMVWHFNEK